MPSAIALTIATLAIAQLATLLLIVVRLAPGRNRHPPVRATSPAADRADAERWTRVNASVSVVVPARNEAARIGRCLTGLAAQDSTMTEALIVDGGSTDGTRDLVRAAANADERIRLVDEPPRPPGFVGRPWAIAAGARAAKSSWVLIVDADVIPEAGMVRAVVAAAEQYGYDVVSFSPRIVTPSPWAQWLQASFVISLVYRFGASGADVTRAERAVANGQCQLVKRDVLERAGGYEVAARSYCDDITIVRTLASAGARAGFLDGSELFSVVMYETARDTWRGWPRSLNMRDATTPGWRVTDALTLLLGQALPIIVLLALLGDRILGGGTSINASVATALLTVNGALFAVRVLLLAATARSFERRGAGFWLSPLADPATALRVAGTMFTRSREWRGTPVAIDGKR
jgi:dolichol-phosphate mannosyltransferase